MFGWTMCGAACRSASMADQSYRVTTVSGEQFVWTGSLDEFDSLEAPNLRSLDEQTCLVCPGGTLVNMAHVESISPVGS